MSNLEVSKSVEVNEGLTASSEIPSLETTQAKELLESTENVLTSGLEQLSASEKLIQFQSLESKCAEIEGRIPRAVEAASLEHGDFKSSDEKVSIDSEALSEMKNLSPANLSALKNEVFSHSSEVSGSKNVAFRSYSECVGCIGSCRGDCSGGTKCYGFRL